MNSGLLSKMRIEVICVCIGYVIAFLLGTMAIAPVGPGSEWVFYGVLFAYSLFVVVLRLKAVKMVSILLAIIFGIGTIVELKIQKDSQRMRENARREKLERAR